MAFPISSRSNWASIPSPEYCVVAKIGGRTQGTGRLFAQELSGNTTGSQIGLSTCPHFSRRPHFSHPATIVASQDGARLETLRFEARSADLETVFLPRLWNAYTRLQKAGALTFVPAWELRAAFCFENSCQPSVFNNLFSQQYARGDGYELHMEIQRQLPRSETPLRAGARNIGSVRVAKK